MGRGADGTSHRKLSVTLNIPFRAPYGFPSGLALSAMHLKCSLRKGAGKTQAASALIGKVINEPRLSREPEKSEQTVGRPDIRVTSSIQTYGIHTPHSDLNALFGELGINKQSVCALMGKRRYDDGFAMTVRSSEVYLLNAWVHREVVDVRELRGILGSRSCKRYLLLLCQTRVRSTSVRNLTCEIDEER
jgi:hypothetical protein